MGQIELEHRSSEPRRAPIQGGESFSVLILKTLGYTCSVTSLDLRFFRSKHPVHFVSSENDTKNLNFMSQARLALPREPAQIGDLSGIPG